jgi:hypothetical protein
MLPGPAKVGAHAPGVQPRKRGAKPPSIGYPGRRSRERPSKTTGNADNQPNRLSVRASHPIEMNRHPASRCNRCSGGAFDQLAALPYKRPELRRLVQGPEWVACCRTPARQLQAAYADCIGQHPGRFRPFDIRAWIADNPHGNYSRIQRMGKAAELFRRVVRPTMEREGPRGMLSR